MDKVPYALKIETPETCLTLSARYGEQGHQDGSIQGSRGGGWRHFYPGVLLERALSLPVVSVS